MDQPVASDSPEKKKEYDKYECENMARTLIEAEQIKADPKKMAAVSSHLESTRAAIDKINPKEGLDGLKKMAKKKINED